MDSFSQIICWHPGFHIESLAKDCLILIGETESYLLRGEEFYNLFLYIDGTGSIHDIVSTSSAIPNQALLWNAVDKLMGKGLIIEKKGIEDRIIYYKPDFDSEPEVFQFYGGLLELRILSGFDDPDFLVQWVKQLKITHPTGVVIADDYLDTRLATINRLYAEEKRGWLLIKTTGERPLVGPFFSPEKQNTPCWQCLSSRFVHNQPVRKWLQGIQEKGTLRIPACYEKDAVKKVFSAAMKPAQEYIAQQRSGSLLTVDPNDMSFTEHPVSFLPQCPCCGDPDIFTKKGQSPITLNPCPKIHITDGGVRSFPPCRTIERLRHSISSITGIIGDLSFLPGQKETGVPIYRTLFFKTPGFRCEPESNDFLQISLGKGMSEEQSKAGALCESIERHSAQYQGDEPCLLSAARDMDSRPVLPHELAGFSESQYRKFSDPRHPESRSPYSVQKYREDIPISWTPAWSLTDEKSYYVPLTYCYANTPLEEGCFSRFNSNGCAAGNTLEEALLQGFLELVERDAVAIWWYNKIKRPSVSLDMLSEENNVLLRQTLDNDWDYWVLDITHDFLIPVMVAVARHKKDKTYRLGFGCHISPVLACQRSLAELCQLIAIKNRGQGAFDFDAIGDESYLLPVNNVPKRNLSDFVVIVHADIKDDILYCVEKAAKLGLKTLAVDYTRPDIPIHTARVIVPGLCHIWPQLGNERLYKVPVVMGWNKAELNEARIHLLPLLI